jgi:uncharacterized protein (UPF0147 family)
MSGAFQNGLKMGIMVFSFQNEILQQWQPPIDQLLNDKRAPENLGKNAQQSVEKIL